MPDAYKNAAKSRLPVDRRTGWAGWRRLTIGGMALMLSGGLACAVNAASVPNAAPALAGAQRSDILPVVMITEPRDNGPVSSTSAPFGVAPPPSVASPRTEQAAAREAQGGRNPAYRARGRSPTRGAESHYFADAARFQHDRSGTRAEAGAGLLDLQRGHRCGRRALEGGPGRRDDRGQPSREAGRDFRLRAWVRFRRERPSGPHARNAHRYRHGLAPDAAGGAGFTGRQGRHVHPGKRACSGPGRGRGGRE